MRSAGSRMESQHPPWRHSLSHHVPSDEEGEAEVANASARAPHHVPILTPHTNTDRPLRPPPIFDLRYAEEKTSSTSSSHAGAVHSEDWHRLERPEFSPQEKAPSSDVHGFFVPLHSARPSAVSASMQVPVSHWRQSYAHNSAAASSQSTHDMYKQVTRKNDPKDEIVKYADREVDTRKELAEEGNRDALCNASVVEHYHIRELEEKLQYWRQRALQTEGRSLQRERAIKEKYRTDFATAQATSEAVIRQLLDKQYRIQQQQKVLEKARQRLAPSRTVSALSPSAPTSSATSQSSTVSHGDDNGSLKGKLKTKASEQAAAEASSGRLSSSTTSSHSKKCTAANRDSDAQSNDLQQRVSELVSENAALSAALAAVQQQAKDSATAAIRRHRATSMECTSTTAGQRLVTAASSSKETAKQVADSSPKVNDSATRDNISFADVQSQTEGVVEVLLQCLEHSTELRQCCTTLNSVGENVSDEVNPSEDDVMQAEEKKRRDAIIESLRKFVSAAEIDNRVDDSASTQSAWRREAIQHQLATLRAAVEYLDVVVLTSVDDIVVAHSRWEEDAATRLHQRQSDALARQDLNDVRETLQQAYDKREKEHKEELHALRASVAQQEKRYNTCEEELQRARRTIHGLREELEKYAVELRAQESTVRQLQAAQAAQVAEVRDNFTEEIMDAARRVSAAEHECHLLLEREAQWRTRLAAATAARDAYAQECAILKHRLEVLQLRTARNVRHDLTTGPSNSIWGKPPAAATGTGLKDTTQLPITGITETDTQLKASSSAALEAYLRRGGSVSPIPPRDVPANYNVDEHHVNDATKTTVTTHQAGTRDMHEDATTPRRSLSYSPPESAEKPTLSSRRSPCSARSSEKTNRTYRDGLAARTDVEASNQDNRRENMGLKPRSVPVLVVQPSLVDHYTAEEGIETGDGEAHDVVRRDGTISPYPTGGVSPTPLARMKAWEEKFKSILTPA